MSNIALFNSFLSFITNKNKHPRLPHWLFLFGTYFFPQINIEVICKHPDGSFYLTWRDDQFKNYGWHIPGGIIRPNESLIDRVKLTINDELPFLSLDNASFELVGFSQVLSSPPSIRSHFFSLVYVCSLSNFFHIPFDKRDTTLITYDLPENTITNHLRYAPLFKSLRTSSIPPPFREY